MTLFEGGQSVVSVVALVSAPDAMMLFEAGRSDVVSPLLWSLLDVTMLFEGGQVCCPDCPRSNIST